MNLAYAGALEKIALSKPRRSNGIGLKGTVRRCKQLLRNKSYPEMLFNNYSVNRQ